MKENTAFADSIVLRADPALSSAPSTGCNSAVQLLGSQWSGQGVNFQRCLIVQAVNIWESVMGCALGGSCKRMGGQLHAEVRPVTMETESPPIAVHTGVTRLQCDSTFLSGKRNEMK